MTGKDEPPLRLVELQSLHQTEEGYFEWKEKARWIKLEEDIEEGSGRWSKPYIPKLSYETISDLQTALCNGDLLLDIDSSNFDEIVTSICDSLVLNDIVDSNYVHMVHEAIIASNHQKNGTEKTDNTQKHIKHSNVVEPISDKNIEINEDVTVIQFHEDNNNNNNHYDHHLMSDVLKWITPGSEATNILLANIPYTKKTSVIFVRFKEATLLGYLLPVRFLYLVIGSNTSQAFYEIGRAIGALSSREHFWQTASTCKTKDDLLSGIVDYLLTSSILPPGIFDSNVWTQSLSKWTDNTHEREKYLRRKSSNGTQGGSQNSALELMNEKTECEETDEDPLARIGTPFAGLIRDLKRKLPFYLTDFTDAFNARCLIAVIFIYFCFLAPAITFAAILSKKTHGMLGISEMITSTAVCGIIFGFFSGQPLIILGATGPLLVMEESIFHLSELVGVEFLAWRAWIGFWITLFCILVVAFDLCCLVNYFTLFTEEIISACVSMVFIFESMRHIYEMISEYFEPRKKELSQGGIPCNATLNITCGGTYINVQQNDGKALMTIILLFGTAMLCHYILKLRHSHYFSRQLRRLLSDFGTLISVVIFVMFDYLMKDDYTAKLDIPDGFTPTSPSKRSWMIDIMGKDGNLSYLAIIFASIPAFLVTIILFMETELTGTILDRKGNKLKKGSGYNLDLLIVGLLISLCSVFGLPWMCACPVHSIQHLNSLSIFNKNHVPGTRAEIVRVIEQRATNILMHVLLGLSVFVAPILREIPLAVLLGVFLYLGITALTHLKLSERFMLLFIPTSHHPDSAVVRKLKTKKIHLFTCIQLFCVLAVFSIKNTVLAPSFPFLILLTLPLRQLLERFFDEEELYELDQLHEESFSGDMDEYDLAHCAM